MRLLLAQRHLALLICAAALLLRLLVPTGYMVASEGGRLAITACPGMVASSATEAMPGMTGGMPDHGKSTDHDKAEQPCAFAGLSAAMTGATDPVQIAALIAFIVAVGLAGVLSPTPLALAYLRPPLRGPPAAL